MNAMMDETKWGGSFSVCKSSRRPIIRRNNEAVRSSHNIKDPARTVYIKHALSYAFTKFAELLLGFKLNKQLDCRLVEWFIRTFSRKQPDVHGP